MLRYELECLENPLKCSLRISEAGSRRILYLDTIKAIAKAIDQPAVSFLTKIHLRSPNISRSLDTTPLQQIVIPAEQTLEALRLLAPTGRLFFKGKVLRGEFGSFSKIFWRGEESGLFTAVIDWKGEEIPFPECAAIFPEWCISKETVFPLKTNVSWKWVQKFFSGPLVLQGALKKQFLEEEPQILWKKETPKKAPLQVFPCLELTDATGCFANLWMEYAQEGRVAFEDLDPKVGKQLRLKEEEKLWEKDLIESGFLPKVVGHSRYYCEGNRVREVLSFLLELGWKVLSKEKKKVSLQTAISWDVKKDLKGVAVEGTVSFQEKNVSLRLAMQEKSLWLNLDHESVGLLDAKKWEHLEGNWEEERLIVPTLSFVSIADQFPPSNTRWEESLYKMAKNFSSEKEDISLGEGFSGTLLPYQQKGLNFLGFIHKWGFSGLLADEMGLGKTVQVLAFFSTLGKNLQALVVVPSSLLYQWEQEVRKFLPGIFVSLYTGRDREISRTQGVTITSYAVLREDAEILAKHPFDVIVLDESNAIKTASTQTARAASSLQSKFKIALTGTPVENRMEEMISQFAFLMPGLIEKKISMDRLRKQIKPFILRRTKEDVAIDLPEKMEQTVWVEMNEAQKSIYLSMQEQIQKGILRKVEKEGMATHRMEVLEAILRLRQICVDPRLIGEEVMGAKLELLLEDIGTRKVLIYSQFTTMLQWIRKALEERGLSFLYLDGATSPEDRAKRVAKFQEEEGARIFLLSLKAGGVGLNLTAAEGVFLMDPWWNEAVEAQAIARAHRLGAKKSILVKRYLTPHSIEEKILRLKTSKQEVANLLLSGADEASLTEEDLLHLLT